VNPSVSRCVYAYRLLHVANVALFDANGNRLGFATNTADSRNLNKDNQGAVPQGAVMDGGMAQLDVGYLIEGDSGKPEYITVSASGFDAVCIMEVVVKHPVSFRTFRLHTSITLEHRAEDARPNLT
jgi:hypothetical protein